jgi:hypothetical protein
MRAIFSQLAGYAPACMARHHATIIIAGAMYFILSDNNKN